MKIPFKIVLLIAEFLWISSVTMFIIGRRTGESVFSFAAGPDALIVLVFSAMAARKWAGGSQ